MTRTDEELALQCRAVAVGYGAAPVLSGLDLNVAPGEVMALLGPSGSGKTTLLHAVAGFVPLRHGEIRLVGHRVATPGHEVAPHRRDVGMVFQHFALWPHLTVLDIVAYPLRRHGAGRAAARQQARQLLTRMEIDELAQRRPAELSGGQQQRVGLARALARDAALYLFDEPTAHLDTHLRTVFQQEVAQRRGATDAAALYATHDPEEAFALADRVALLRDGHVVQQATPREVYEQPIDEWAARLTGPATVLECPIAAAGDELVRITVDGVGFEIPGDAPASGVGLLLLRPDWAELEGPLPATVSQVLYRGPHTDHVLDTPAGAVTVRAAGPPRRRPGERTGWGVRHAWVLPAAGERDPPASQPNSMAGPG